MTRLVMSRSEELGLLSSLQQRSTERASPATLESWSQATQMTAEEMAAVLAYRRNAVIASTRADGRPHAVPGGFVFVGGEVWLPTSSGAVRQRNVARHPSLTMVVTEGDGADHAALLIEGPAREIGLTDAPPAVSATYEEKYGQRADWAGSWLVLIPKRVLSHRAEAWSAPSPLRG